MPVSAYLSEHDVVELARYAQVSLSDDELGPMTSDLNDLIEALEPLLSLDGASNGDAAL